MATFTGKLVKDTYKSVLKLEDNLPLTANLKKIQDGEGNDSPVSVSTDAVSFDCNIEASGFTIPGGTGNQYLKADGSVGIIAVADLDFVDFSEGIVNNLNEDTKAPTVKAVVDYVSNVSGSGDAYTAINNAGDADLDINFTTPNWHCTVDGTWTMSISGMSSFIGRSGTITIYNNTATSPGALPTEMKTPNGDSIVWNTTAGTTSLISYYIVNASTVLINYIGNFA